MFYLKKKKKRFWSTGLDLHFINQTSHSHLSDRQGKKGVPTWHPGMPSPIHVTPPDPGQGHCPACHTQTPAALSLQGHTGSQMTF